MFGEVFEYDIATIAPWTGADSGSMSVLDFPMKKALSELMDGTTSDFATLAAPLALDSQLYANPYELMTFYDNHDMGRLNADDDGFVDAHNWLFTARGIPVIYYGSEIGFMRGKVEHAGNRNYFGVENVAAAKEHRIREQLARIANLRRESIALQRGLQVNVELAGDRAAFYRVYQRNVVAQVALVLLNKGDAPADFRVDRQLQAGTWRGAFSGETREVGAGGVLEAQVPAHGVEVFLLDAAVTEPALLAELDKLMQAAAPHTNGG
jgi:cyclomaltodextrin glucanotransferase